jgi:Holliday junction resolvase
VESKLQSEIIKWLKGKGAYVIKTKPGPGTPVGCPDIIALYRAKWLAIEVKADITSKFQVGQRETLDHLSKGNDHVRIVYPQNWDEVREQLLSSFF